MLALATKHITAATVPVQWGEQISKSEAQEKLSFKRKSLVDWWNVDQFYQTGEMQPVAGLCENRFFTTFVHGADAGPQFPPGIILASFSNTSSKKVLCPESRSNNKLRTWNKIQSLLCGHKSIL